LSFQPGDLSPGVVTDDHELHTTAACMTSEGTPDGEVFLSYLSDFLCPVLKEGQVVITDNAGDHKVEGVKELIERTD